MCGLFNDDYFHIGGDECNGNQWNANKDIQAFMKAKNMKSNHELQAYLNLHLNQILKKNNKIMMGWEEIKNTQLPKDIMVHAWHGPETLIEAVKEGYHVIYRGAFILI
jgi:hexosaminidase